MHEETLRGHMKEPKYQISVANTQGLVVGDHNTIIQHFTANIKSFSVDYATRIQNFLAEYLGTNKNPIPFGGREEDLSQLDNWLSDLGSPPYLLLVAPAGRGKSTLLVRWIERLQAREDLILIFFPISIRFRTNLASVFFPALTSQLALLTGKKVPENPDTPIEVWRALFTDYLSQSLADGRRLLLVLDGLDEAADWEVNSDLFPLVPPEGLRIVLSARNLAGDVGARAWLRRVGWDRSSVARALELSPLTREGVADVLKRMGLPLTSLGLRSDIISELHRLSEGDPLLIRLYVDDLRSRGSAAARLHAEELRTIRPGLEGYFDSWWKEQRTLWGNSAPLREPAVQEFFTLLSCAFGPLSKEEVLHLARPEARLSGLMLEEVLIPLNRFVIGDGRLQGYAFSHPRLGSYFYEEKLTRPERQGLESRFLSWGSETVSSLNSGEILPDQASSYIVQYYGAHLERANSSIESFLPLLSNGWRRAWEASDGTYARFLADVERVWRAAEKEGNSAASRECSISRLGSEIHCALCLTSINSISKVLPPELLVSLVKTGIWTPTQGVAYALLLVDSEQKDESLAQLSPFVARPIETVRLIKSTNWQMEALKILAEAGYTNEALQAVWSIISAPKQAEALANIASFLTEKHLQAVMTRLGKTEVAKTQNYRSRIVFALTEKRLQEAQKAMLSGSRANQGEQGTISFELLLTDGLKQARSFKDEAHRTNALLSLSPYLTEDQKSDLLQEIFPAARSRKYDRYDVSEAIARLMPHLSTKLRQVVFKRALAIGHDQGLAEVLIALAPYLIQAGFLEEILSRINEIRDLEARARILVELIPFMPHRLKHQTLQEVKEVIQDFDEGGNESNEGEEDEDSEWEEWRELRTKIATRLAEIGDYQEALQIARRAQHKEDRVHTLVALARLLPERLQRKVLLESLEIAREVKDRTEQVKTLASLISLLIDKGYSSEALQIVEAIKDRFAMRNLSKGLIELGYPAKDIVNLIRGLADLGRFKEALEMVHEIEQEYRAASLTILAAFLPQTFLQEALRLALTVKAIEGQTSALTALATRLAGLGHTREALEVVRSIKVEMFQEKALAALAVELAKMGYLQEARKAASAIRSDYSQAKCLATVAAQLAQAGHYHEAIDIAVAIKDKGNEESYAEVVEKVAPLLPKPFLHKVLKTVTNVSYKSLQTRALIGLIPYLSEKSQQEALETVRAIEADEYKTKVLTEVADSLSRPLIREVLKIVQGMGQEYWRAVSLERAAPQLVQAGFSREVLVEIRGFGSEAYQAMVLVKLISVLPKRHLKEALNLLRCMKENDSRIRILVALVSRAAEEGLLSEVMIEVRKIWYTAYRAKVLIELIPFLLKERFKHTWGKIKQLKRKNYKAKAFIDLSVELAKEGYPPSTLEMINEKDEHGKEFLGRLVSELAANYHSLHVLEMLWMIEDEEFQAKTLEKLAVGLVKEGCFKEAAEAVMAVRDFAERIRAITSLAAAFVEKGRPEEALKMVLRIDDYMRGTEALINLAVKLVEEGYPEKALEAVRHIEDGEDGEDDEDKTEWPELVDLIPLLIGGGYLYEALEILQSFEGKTYQLEAQERFATETSNLPLSQIYPIWRKLLHGLNGYTRPELLVDLASLAWLIFALGGIEAIEAVSRSILEVGQWWP